MKTKLRHSIAFIFSLISLISSATGLEGDVIYIDEHKWQLLAKPLLCDSLMCAKLEKHLPQGRSVSTANWKGYTAYWMLHENMLYLHHIKVPMYDKKNAKDYTIYLTLDTLKTIFPTYDTKYGIEARWYNEKTRAAKGELIRYEHGGFDRNYSEEYVMTFENGKLKEKHLYHNKVLQKNLNESNFGNAIFNSFLPIMRKDSFVEWGTYREVIITNMEFSPEGRLTNCKICFYYVNKGKKVRLDDQEHEYIKVLKQAVKDLYIQERYYINGIYVEMERKGFSFNF